MRGDAGPQGAEADDLHGLLLRSPRRIEALLHRLRLHRSLLSVRVEGSDQWHASMVVAVDAPRRRFHLDALNPPPAQPLAAGTRIAVRGRVDGGDLRFKCRYAGASIIEAEPAIEAELPEDVFVLERRAAYRLNLPPHLQLPPSAIGRERPEHRARLVDVSHVGAGAVVPADVQPAVGDELRMLIQLPGATVHTDAEVRSAAAQGDGVRIGLHFEKLRSDEENRLAHAVNSLERQLIRATRARR